MKLIQRVCSQLAMASIALILFQGCAGMDNVYRGTVGMTNPDATRLSTTLKWMSRQPRVRPVSGDDMIVYARFKNSAGADLNLNAALRDELQKAGYRLTRNIDEAHFVIIADLRYFGESKSVSLKAPVTGAVIGAGAGAVLGNNSNDFSTEAGAIGGAVIGAAVGNVMATRNPMRTIDLVVDLEIGERIKGGVDTKRSSDSNTGVSHTGGSAGGGGNEGGRGSSGSSESQNVKVVDNFLYHSNTVTATASKMNLTLNEARPALTARLARAVAGVL